MIVTVGRVDRFQTGVQFATHLEDWTAIQKDCPFDNVLQFPNIAGPGVTLDHCASCRTQRANVASEFLRIELSEMLGEREYVLDPLAQRRKPQTHDVQPVKQILSKSPGSNLSLQVPIGRCNHSNIDLDRTGPADPIYLALLQSAEQFGLDLKRHLGHFIQQQCPGMRKLK